jgi:uncharacterized protein (DUF885 family)
MRRLLVLGFLATSLFAADPAFDRFADQLAADWMRANPEAATRQQYFSGPEQDALDRQLTPVTPAALEGRVNLARRGLAELARFDRMKFSDMQRASASMLDWQFEETIRTAAFDAQDLLFNQFWGLQVRLVNFLTETHPIRNQRDIENYLVRLSQVAARIEEGLAQARARAERGIIPPKFIITSTLAQLDRFTDADRAAKNVLVVSLGERMAKIPTLEAAQREQAQSEAEQIVARDILPAFHRIAAMLREQNARATDDAGLWRLPDGDKAYAAALQRYTTTKMSADEIHALGLKEVARIEVEMDKLLRELGLTKGSVSARYAELEVRLQPKEADPRGALLQRYREFVRDAEKRAESLFDLRPQAPCEVRREPPFTEATAAARYTGPARDGSRPGIFWVPLPRPPFRVVSMRSLTYHEAVPGHHFQIAIQAESTELPPFRRDNVYGIISAHVEGWALYAERLAAENNWYEGDKVGALGQLNSELFRARRLVVDTGLHAKKWTRQQAIDYGISAPEVERYVAIPGQACSYKIGELRLLAVREKLRQKLGASFSLKEFHNVILRNGNLPLDVLETILDRWAEAKVRG